MILKENLNSTILVNQKEINYILGILENDKEEFPIFTQKAAIVTILCSSEAKVQWM